MLINLVTKNCRHIFRYAWLYLLFLILLTSVASFFASTLPVETSLESLILENDSDLLFYEKFKEQFGEDEFLVIGFNAPDVFSPDILQFIKLQTAKLEALAEVREIISLTNVDEFAGSDNDFIVRPLVGDFPVDAEMAAALRQRALSSHLIKDSLLGENGTATLFLLRPQKFSDVGSGKALLVKKVEQVFATRKAQYVDIKCHIAGWLVTDSSMSSYMNRDLALFVPLTYVVLIIFLGLALRNLWAVLISLINLSICLIWTLALLNLIGGALSPVTSILLPLMMALAVSDSIHLFVDFFKRDRGSGDLPTIMQKTLKSLAVPCFLTSLTTAIGFLSLGVSDIPPIRCFGFAAAGGMMFEFCLSMTIVPLGVYLLRHKISLQRPSKLYHSSLPGFLKGLATWVVARRGMILWSSAVLVIISLYGVTLVAVETDLLNYFKKNSPVHQGALFIDKELGGVNTIEISFYADAPDAILQPENLAVLDKIDQFLQSQPIVSQITSINSFLKEMNKAFYSEAEERYELPASKALAAQYLLLYDGDELENFIDSEYQWARMSARVTAHNSRVIATSIKALRDYVATEFADSGLEIRVTGKTFLANKLVKDIVDSQVQSLALAFGLIFIVLLVVFRSLRLGLLSLIPNALPIACNLGFMGYVGIPLNSATAIISAVAIGIAVDDTIHFICHYQSEIKGGLLVNAAVRQTITVKGSPVIMTSLIMVAVYSLLMLASFVPTIQFGFLSAMIMLFALVGDLVVLPAVLLR